MLGKPMIEYRCYELHGAPTIKHSTYFQFHQSEKKGGHKTSWYRLNNMFCKHFTPRHDVHLLFQALIFFQIQHLIKLKVDLLLLPINETMVAPNIYLYLAHPTPYLFLFKVDRRIKSKNNIIIIITIIIINSLNFVFSICYYRLEV
jgi:hypothetical protein